MVAFSVFLLFTGNRWWWWWWWSWWGLAVGNSLKIYRTSILSSQICTTLLWCHRIFKPQLATAAVHTSMMSICLSVCLSVCRQNAKMRFSQKVSNLELCFLLTTYRKSHMGFSQNLLLDPKIQHGGDPPSWIVTPKCKNAIFWKLSNLVSCNWVFQSIHYWIPKKSKMAEIRHLENRHDVIFFCRGWSDLDKTSETGAEWHIDCGDVVEIETRCRIPIWRTFGRIQWHVIPEPRITM